MTFLRSAVQASAILLTLTLYADLTSPLYSSSEKKEKMSALYNGDFLIGALFAVRHQPRQKKTDNAHFLECGEIRELYGIQRIEATYKALDMINADSNLLPNITLGAEIRDSCWYAPVALQQTIELVRDSLTPADSAAGEVCLATEAKNRDGTTLAREKSRGTLIGVVGPGSSSVAMQVQNLLQLFAIPQVAYSATSRDLSDKSRFRTFMRVVPSDYYQAQLMVDLVRWHNWTYVSAVNTDENYGHSGMAAFRELATRAGVCVAREDSVLSTAADEDFDAVVRHVRGAGGGAGGAKAHVVVCFCEGMTVRGLLAALRRTRMAGTILIIGSDGWADRSDVVQDYEQEAHGSISVRIHSPYVKWFDDHYFQLRPDNNKRNPWFREFWQERFFCHLPEEAAAISEPVTAEIDLGPVKPGRMCTGKDSLRQRYRQDPKLNFVVKAIYTMAHALHNMQRELCEKPEVGACAAMFPFNGTLFKSYLMNTSFVTDDGDLVEFDQHGDPPGRYEIINYQQLPNGSFDYVHVGDWVDGALSFRGQLQFAGAGATVTTNPADVHSVCSQPCAPGYYKNFQSGGPEKRCCWVCVGCDKHEILFNETNCQPCPDGWYPNGNKTECLQSPIEYMKWSDSEAIVAMSFSFFGFGITAFTASVFIRYNDTPVVKSSTRELSYLILFGMMISHAATFPILAKPSILSCTLSRTMPGISFAIIYGSLLTKTNRIARILAGSKKRFPTRKPRFMSGTAQLIITSLMIGVEAAVAGWTVARDSAAPLLLHPSRERAALACASSARAVLVPLAVPGALVALCTLYAVRTRVVPANFNEAKFIGFAMYTTCVIWVAFVPIYFGSESKIITKCICVSLSAMVTLVFLFMPKLYIIIFRPEKNNRALFTTSKSIRCHIGSRVASAISNKSSHSFSSSRDTESHGHQRKSVLDEEQSTASWKSLGKTGERKSQNVNWKDEQQTPKQGFPVGTGLKPDLRTLSCQTSTDLLHCLLQLPNEAIETGGVTNWVELNPKILLSAYSQNGVQKQNCKNASPNLSAKSLNSTIHCTKQSSVPLLHSKARIREENVSECSLSDEDNMAQIKSITITLGSVNSLDKLNTRSESDVAVIQDSHGIKRRKNITESIPLESNGHSSDIGDNSI